MKKVVIILFVLISILSMAIPAYANSAEPPTVIILTTNLPEDAVISVIIPSAGETEDWHRNHRVDKLWESYYRLWFNQYTQSLDGAYIQVTTSEKTFTCPLPQEMMDKQYRHNTLLTLDYQKETLTMGQNPWRQPLLTALRIILTLLTEGLVFFLFGFRSRRSWVLFFAVNLLTQGWLNISINSNAFSGYWILSYILMEALIFLVEPIAFALLTKERKGWQRIVYALTANAVSLALGILLIGHLPL